MAWSPDAPESTAFVEAFSSAWEESIKDYVARRINSEHCLQASLYLHLRSLLPVGYRVFVEAVVRLGEAGSTDTGKSKVVVDLLIEHDGLVVGAVELKFTPRGEPTTDGVRKDLTSLAFLTSRRATEDRVRIEMPRFRHSEQGSLQLKILPQRKLVFAAFCSDESSLLRRQHLWQRACPQTGMWEGRPTHPKNLAVFLALTKGDGTALTEAYGPPLARLGRETAANAA
jgi:hypothetical protein